MIITKRLKNRLTDLGGLLCSSRLEGARRRAGNLMYLLEDCVILATFILMPKAPLVQKESSLPAVERAGEMREDTALATRGVGGEKCGGGETGNERDMEYMDVSICNRNTSVEVRFSKEGVGKGIA